MLWEWVHQWLVRAIGLLTILLILSGLSGCAKTIKPEPPQQTSGGVRFTLFSPEAKQVFLVGSFNGWAQGATPMKIVDGSSLWSVELSLSEGEHTFMYVIDGVRWMTPPHAEDFVTDGFGHINGVVIVR